MSETNFNRELLAAYPDRPVPDLCTVCECNRQRRGVDATECAIYHSRPYQMRHGICRSFHLAAAEMRNIRIAPVRARNAGMGNH